MFRAFFMVRYLAKHQKDAFVKYGVPLEKFSITLKLSIACNCTTN
ncbi:MAG: hypothetical protein ACI86L_000039 [Dokdonia sp.]|jgi:hypothetical protein